MHPLIYVPKRRVIAPPRELWTPGPNVRGLGMGMGMGLGLGASRPFSPADLLSGYDGLFADLDYPGGGMVRNTAPNPLDTPCDDVTQWLAGNTAALTNVSASPRAGNCMHVRRNGSNNAFAYQNLLIANNRYLVTGLWARGDGVVIPRLYTGNFPKDATISTAWQDMTVDWTPTVAMFGLLCSGINDLHYSEFDGQFALSNLSLSQITCRGNLGNLVQATAANMRWGSHASAPTSVLLNGHHVVYSDGVADYDASSGAASTWPLHKEAGFTYTEVIGPNAAAAGTDTLWDTHNVLGTNVGGAVEYDATNQQIVVKVANGDGGGTFVVNEGSGAGTVPKGSFTRVAVTWTEAAGVIIRTDEDAPVTAASVGAASAADATATLNVGRTSGGANFFHGGRAGMILRIGAATQTEITNWLAWAKGYYAL